MVIAWLAVLGLVFGSFVNALVWRLHEHKALSIVRGRSICPHCRHMLAAKDLMPLLSWLYLHGRCRYCRRPISVQYPLVEALTAGLFVISYVWWPLSFHGGDLLQFIFWLVFVIGFVALAVYDLRWMLLPNRIIYPLLGLAVVQLIVISLGYHGGLPALEAAGWGVLIIGGLFYLLFQLSGGRWIGGGDVKLGGLLGILVGGPLNSLLLIFIASVSGTLVSLPLMAAGRARHNTQIPFGPFLLLAAVIVRLFGASLAGWLRQRALVPY